MTRPARARPVTSPTHGLEVVDLPRTALLTLRLAVVAERNRPPKGQPKKRYRLNLKPPAGRLRECRGSTPAVSDPGNE
jgi:hypothetical protein